MSVSKTKSLSAVPILLPEVSTHMTKHHRRALVVIAAVLVLLGGAIGAATWYFQGRAMPNVTLASIDISGKTKAEIGAVALAQSQKIELAFESGGQKTPASLADVGVTIDIDKTIEQALSAKRSWLDMLLFWQPKSVALSYVSDLGIAKAFAKEHFPSVVTDAKDAQVVFNSQSNKFDIQPGEPGEGFDAVAFVRSIEYLAADPSSVTLPVTTATVEPVVQEAKLEPVQAKANQALTLPIKFVYQGKVFYTASPGDIANWAHFTPEPSKNSAELSYDQAKIEQFLNQQVGPAITSPAVDRKVVRDEKTGREVVIQNGREGRQLDNIGDLATQILSSLQNNTPLEKEVAITTAPFKTVTLSGTDRWIEVDLSEQRTSLYLGVDRVASFSISSGIWKFPTVTGEFAIRYKTANQVMSGGSKATGDYYYLPNVTWVSYFYKDYAFHTAYWHNNFGHPMSHGCINMRYDDAKALYDFAPLGTKVIVHA